MLRKKGIVRQTFLYSALLVLIVVLLLFTAMYVITPGYYLRYKERRLGIGVDELAEKLRAAPAEEECAALIEDFSEANNVEVLSYGENEVLLPAVSTPFIGFGGDNTFTVRDAPAAETGGNRAYSITVSNKAAADAELGEDGIARAQETISLYWSAGNESSDNAINLERQVDSELIDLIKVTGTLQPIDEAKAVIFSLIPYVSAIAIALGLLLAWIYAKQISKPILKISSAALKMQQMEPGVVSGIRSKDELGALSENLDVLYAKLLMNIEDLKEETDRSARLERAKTELMHSASHELKTPVAALNGMIQGMLDNVGAYADKDKYLRKCKEQIDRLSRLVSEILDASRADDADREPELAETSVDGLVREAIGEYGYLIRENGLRVEENLPECRIMTDPDMLYRVISNLVSNAVRYTPAGGMVNVAITGEGMARRLCIENECDAIPPEELTKLFEPFYTRSYSRDKAESGTGLGLYIVKRSLERLGIGYETAVTDTGFKIILEVQTTWKP